MNKFELQGQAAVGFDMPLDMLQACHEKILRQCRTLEKLQHYLPEHGVDKAVRDAAAAVLRYFSTSGLYHHQDEELNLFPRLRQCSSDARLHQLLDSLLLQHAQMLADWAQLQPQLERLVQGEDGGDYALISRFIQAYRAHVALENAELLPQAKRLLSPQMQLQLGVEMAQRRGVNAPAQP